MNYKILVYLFMIGIVLTGFTIPKPLVCPLRMYSNWDETTSEKTMNRELKKETKKSGVRNFRKIGSIRFSHAYLNYLKTGVVDTLLFYSASENYINSYSKAKNSGLKAEALFYVGLCNYFTGDYKKSQLWFYKHSKCNDTVNACVPLWFAKSLLKTELNDSANVVINNYCVMYNLNKDSIKTLIDQDIKNGQ